MAAEQPDLTPPRTWVAGLRAAMRVVLIVTALVALYYVVPFDRPLDSSLILYLIGTMILLVGLAILEVRAITRAAAPGLKAIEALAVLVPLLILSFAAAYYLMSQADSSIFTEPLSRTDALYFALTVFSTVGFGDISAVSEGGRAVVSVQIAINLVMVGLGLRIIVAAAKRGRGERGT